MSKAAAKRKPNTTLRWVLMLVGVAVVFGGVFAIKAFFAKQTNNFFDNMPQPAVAVSSYVAKTQRWTDNGEAVGTFVAINGTDITTEAGGVIRAIEFEPGQRVSAGTVLFRLNTANEEATLNALETSAKLADVQAQRWQEVFERRNDAVHAEGQHLFDLRRLDVWPVGDYGVRAGLARAHGWDQPPTEREMAALGEAYAPYRSVVAWWSWREADTVTASS